MTVSMGTNTPCEGSDWAPLNIWNQLAPRAYNRFVLCFEIANDRHAAAVSHLQSCVAKLGEHHPVVNSLLELNTPIARIKMIDRPKIPFQLYVISQTFGKTYAQLKEARFPGSAFVAPIFEVPAGDMAHALILRIYLIDGGLLLGIHLHHSLGDGKAVDDVISWLSAETRKDVCDGKSIILPSPFPENDDCPLDGIEDEQLLSPEYIRQRFPERTVSTSSTSQNEETIGNIFVFKVATLNAIRNWMHRVENAQLPSINVTLIALLWAHITKARIQTVKAKHRGDHSRLFTLIDARKRVFGTDEVDRYFGNAVESALTTIPTADLLKICERQTTATFDPDAAQDPEEEILAKLLEPICCSVQASIGEVDANFVRERHMVFSRIPEPQRLVFDYFSDIPGCLMLNSWRYIGLNAGQEWSFPGAPPGVVGYPDAIRRAGAGWNGPAVVILPARPGSEELEVMVTTEVSAMGLLLKDEVLMRSVAGVL